jgi:hypothetical protein
MQELTHKTHCITRQKFLYLFIFIAWFLLYLRHFNNPPMLSLEGVNLSEGLTTPQLYTEV